jgi:Uma2 family endonuclease
MTAPHAERSDPWTALAAVGRTELPEGWRTELVSGEIVITPPPVNGHARIVVSISQQIVLQVSSDGGGLVLWPGGTGLILPGSNGFKPDGIIAPLDAFEDGETEYNEVPGQGIVMVVEVTSRSTRSRDYGPKMIGYAAARIPYFLLIDRRDKLVRLHHLREGTTAYGHPCAVASFGEPLPLPAPLGFALNTSRFS